MTWERVARELRRAHAQWQVDGPHAAARLSAPGGSLSRTRAEELLARARSLMTADSVTPAVEGYRALIVTKAPHTGSDHTVAAIVARCLAFELTIGRVVRRPPADAERIAHALYPDIWLNFVRLPSGNSAWSRIDQIFDNDDYKAIFGEPYRRDAVVTGYQACLDNGLTRPELMEIWQTGREPLTRATAVAAFGRPGADVIFAGRDGDLYRWYRGTHPVGIHKIGSSLMAFSLRHERLYGGRPVIVLNGHFTLLSQRFRGVGDRGTTVIELGLDVGPSIRDVRVRLVGAADRPAECLPGTIRRDAYDGFFLTDAPDDPVVPWANAVHASDGYLAGAIETAAVLGDTDNDALHEKLIGLGYSRVEIEALVMTDPVVVAHGEEQRLTKRTAMLSREECLGSIGRWFPPLGAGNSPPTSPSILSALIEAGGDGSGVELDRARTEPGSRPPLPGTVRGVADLPDALRHDGEALIADGGLGLLVPLAGSGGRFGGYDVAEGRPERLKPLRTVFRVKEQAVSSMDVRAAHAHFLARRGGTRVPLLLSCSRTTAPRVREWLTQNGDVDAEVAMVPEMYRIMVGRGEEDTCSRDLGTVDNVLRDPDGTPLLKPSGSLGLLLAASHSGVLDRWRNAGVRVVAAANADDVGFRVYQHVLGMFVASPSLDAVVLTTPVVVDEREHGPRGGLLRERPVRGGWSAYVEEHARPSTGATEEHFSTNQIYFRLDSLRRLFDGPDGDRLDSVRRRLPLYFEVKPVRVGERAVGALHAYQPYADVLRLLPSVVALTVRRAPGPGQAGGYAPLKSASDIPVAQSVLDAIGAVGDTLSFATS